MKIVKIKVNGKTYQTGDLNAFLTRKILESQRESYKILSETREFTKSVENSEQGEDGYLEHMGGLDELQRAILEHKDKRAWILCEAYKNKFTVDELEKEFTDAELEMELVKLQQGVNEVVTKN